jgi:hypothetical protein
MKKHLASMIVLSKKKSFLMKKTSKYDAKTKFQGQYFGRVLKHCSLKTYKILL